MARAKPKNFPGRKQQRQVGALERLERVPDFFRDGNEQSEIETLRRSLAVSKRAVRTKKDRSASGRFKR